MVRIAREALPFAVPLALLAIAPLFFMPWLSVLPAAALLFTLWFFRDPERCAPDDPDALIAPADGRIIRADDERVSIFMNVFNVHVCRAPARGRVESVHHSSGKFLAAFKDEAPDCNERTEITLATPGGVVKFVLIAGLVARRIVCKVDTGRDLQAGERVGLIRFGSRVDVHLPQGACPSVAIGDRTTAGETVIARLR